MLFESKKHIGILHYFMQDAPELNSRIKKIRKPDNQILVKLAEDYHDIVCEEEQCSIYEKKLPFVKFSFEPLLGITKYVGSNMLSSYYDGHNSFVPEYGGFIYLWMPQFNEKVFFKTGLTYHKFTQEGLDLRTLKIPIQFQYIYKKHKIQPKVSSGINLMMLNYNSSRNIQHTFCLNAGLNYEISNLVSLTTNFNSDYSPITLAMFSDREKFIFYLTQLVLDY